MKDFGPRVLLHDLATNHARHRLVMVGFHNVEQVLRVRLRGLLPSSAKAAVAHPLVDVITTTLEGTRSL